MHNIINALYAVASWSLFTSSTLPIWDSSSLWCVLEWYFLLDSLKLQTILYGARSFLLYSYTLNLLIYTSLCNFQAGCTAVAALLQFFFTAAFTWALIIAFLGLVAVFGKTPVTSSWKWILALLIVGFGIYINSDYVLCTLYKLSSFCLCRSTCYSHCCVCWSATWWLWK